MAVRSSTSPVSRFTPELLADAKYRCEETDERYTSIAARLGIHPYSLRRMGRRLGWKLRPPRDLSAAARLRAHADAMVAAKAAAEARGGATVSSAPQADALRPAAPEHAAPRAAAGERHSAPPESQGAPAAASTLGPASAEAVDFSPGAVARLEAAVLAEIASIERMQAQLAQAPRSTLDASRTAQTLHSLTQTLSQLRCLRGGQAASGFDYDDDDMPADIDAFRIELARRIDAFVASRMDAGDAQSDVQPQTVDEVR